ncbi:uncharacterized protein [Glycine max]|uniref:uncharacterized protein n=1 Tax=Glycine max TaxID=3847 RepID=UPI0003DEA9A8|nr:uncharacterized protein LOC102663276 [Glycine max]|eukprot:XP_006584232.1 uncharacterized protein LOC102663276 [Glycine max]
MPEHHTRQVTTEKLEEAIRTLNAGQANLDNKVESIHSLLVAKFDSLAERFTAMAIPQHYPASSPAPPPHTIIHRHHMKLDVPRFDGHDALGWIFKISQFFDYQGISDQERLTVAAFYMDGPALSWYQWMARNGFFPSCPAMLQALESRFVPSYYDDPQGALLKLQQTGTVSEYLIDFEHLANRTIGLPPSYLLSCFISGLTPELCREVQALRPLSLPQATELARLQEDKLLDRRRGPRAPPYNPNSLPSNRTPPTTSKVPIKRLTPEEMATRREQGLCYQCDEKWAHGHRCKSRLHILIADEDPEPSPCSISPAVPSDIEMDHTLTPHISLNAMEGTPTPQTFRVLGSLKCHQVVILVDGGSTHNFIQSRVAKFLELPSTPTPVLQVMVGNGHTLDCDTLSRQVPVWIQGHEFTLDLHHLPLCGADLVLGVQWLKLLGPITTNYQTLTMTFSHLGQPITLNADAPPTPSSASAHQLKRLTQTQGISALFLLTTTSLQSSPPSSSSPAPISPVITSVLNRYSHIFAEPTQLPPPRNIQHHIHLFPQASPINVRPYRYPHYQKTEIERQISAMLEANLIQPSHSPFSSPILLVKNKDGSWRCCVDYRALNAVTVKDRFPMPTIDELLDDLGQASCFSKLDLR